MTITIANQKGGSGKSTLAINLGISLIDKHKVLIMDTDSQKNIESFTNIRENRDDSKELKHFTLTNRTGNITQSLKQSLEIYDYIIIDTGGIDSTESRKAMLYADILVIPTTPSYLDFEVLLQMLEKTREIKEINESLKICIVMNKISPNPFLHKELQDLCNAIKEAQQSYEHLYLLQSILYDRISYKRAISEGLGINEYNDTKAQIEFQNIKDEILQVASSTEVA